MIQNLCEAWFSFMMISTGVILIVGGCSIFKEMVERWIK